MVVVGSIVVVAVAVVAGAARLGIIICNCRLLALPVLVAIADCHCLPKKPQTPAEKKIRKINVEKKW